jgi:hypothetical protein
MSLSLLHRSAGRSGSAVLSTMAVRAFSGTVVLGKAHGPNLPVDVDHYTSGWNVDDIKDFTSTGKYSVQTFNKISSHGLKKFPSEFYEVEPAEGPHVEHKQSCCEVTNSKQKKSQCPSGPLRVVVLAPITSPWHDALNWAFQSLIHPVPTATRSRNSFSAASCWQVVGLSMVSIT